MTALKKTFPERARGDARSVASHKESLVRRPRLRESLIRSFLFLCGALSILVTIGIVYELGKESMLLFTRQQWETTNRTLAEDVPPVWVSFRVSESGARLNEGDVIRIASEVMRITRVDDTRITVERGIQATVPASLDAGSDIARSTSVTLREFLTRTEWNPQIGKFGVWALVNATMMTSLVALALALPLGLSVAIYLSEYASDRARNTLKPVLEILAGIPTVVYGYFALTFMTPLLRAILGVDTVDIYNTASAGLVIGILILPMVSSMSEDALSAVPQSLRHAAHAVGATKLETAIRVVVPAALSGIAAAFMVAASRAIGETMIVAIAAGAGSAFTFNPFQAAETMTGHIVRISSGDISYDSIDYNSLFAIGLMLFLLTLTLNIISQYIVRRFREVYE